MPQKRNTNRSKSKKNNKSSLKLKFARLTSRKKIGIIFVLMFAIVGAAYLIKSYALDSGAEADFTNRVNVVRSSVGVPGVTSASCLANVARAHAERMARENNLYHINTNDYYSGCNTPYGKVGENIGEGPSVATISAALIASPLHYQNIVDRAFNTIGVGVAYSASGEMFVAQGFSTCGCGDMSSKSPAPVQQLIDTFARGTNNHLWHKYYQGTWSAWEDLGGTLTSGPGVTSRGNGKLDVFAQGTNGNVWHKWFDGSWHEWEDIGQNINSDPAAIGFTNNRLDVFARGPGNNLYHKYYNAGAWSGWENLGGSLSSSPAVAGSGPNDIHVFAINSSKQLIQKFWNGSSWSGWQNLGGALTSDPAAVSWQSGRFDVFARGTDNAMYHTWYDGSWHGWDGLGGTFTSSPGVSSFGPNRLDVFGRGTDNTMFHNYFDGSWHSWESLGGGLTSAPDAVSWH